jgi:hypothetical protein
MATKAPLYRHDLCDGHRCQSVILPAPSKDDVQNILSSTLSPHQKAQNIKRVGWSSFQARPNEDENGVEFVTTREGQELVFGPNHPSHPYLEKQFSKQVAEVEDYLRRRSGDEL